MALPLLVGRALLAKEVIDKAPRFAAALMQSKDSESPLMVERHDNEDKGGMLKGVGTVAKWAAIAAGIGIGGWAANSIADKVFGGEDGQGAGTIVKWGSRAVGAGLGAWGASALMDHFNKPKDTVAEDSTKAKNPVDAAYRKVLGDERYQGLKKSVSDQEKTTAPGEAQKKQDFTNLSPEDRAKRLDYETTLLASSVVAIGFENKVDRKKDGGAFDTLVHNNAKAALELMAPNKLISELTERERMALVTVVIQASTPGYLDQMLKQDPKMFTPEASRYGPKIVEAAKQIGPVEKLTSAYTEKGVFSDDKFDQKFASLVPPGADQKINNESIKQAMFANSVGKADHTLNAIEPLMGSTPEQIPSQVDDDDGKKSAAQFSKRMLVNMQNSLSQRQRRLKSTHQPADAESSPSM